MAVYLINPDERGFLQGAGDRLNLSLLSVAAYNRNKATFAYRDLNHISKHELLKELQLRRPEFAGISAYTSTLTQAKKLAGQIRVASPQTKLIVGGYHPTVSPQDFIQDFDYIVVGEGEKALERILTDYQGNVVMEPPVKNLDDIPYPARDIAFMYRYNLQQEGLRTATLLTSRGCMQSCNFCGGKAMYKGMKQRSVDNVIGEVRELRDRFGFKSLYFLDDSLTTHKDWTMEFAEKMAKEGMKFRITTRADLIDKDKVRALKEAGMNILSFGCETGNAFQLKLINKKETLENLANAAEICKEEGIKFKTFWVLGLPGESEKSVKNTLEFAKRLNSTYADFYLFTPYLGCEFQRHPTKYGLEIVNENPDECLQANKEEDKLVVNSVPETMTAQELLYWHKWINEQWKDFKR